MRFLRYAFLSVLALVLIAISAANRGPVTLRLFTDEVAGWLGLQSSVTLPVYIVILGGVIAGVIVGFIWEWFREHKQRVQATSVRHEKASLEREVGRLRELTPGKDDDVLALLEGQAGTS